MAVNNLEKYTAADGLGFPLNFRRGNPNPLDNSSVWSSLEAAQNYAQTDPTAYVGQVLSVVAGEDVKVYFIKNEDGGLEEMSIEASITAMDDRMDAVESALGLGGEAGEGSVTVDKKIEDAVAAEAKAREEAIKAESDKRVVAEQEIKDSVSTLSNAHAADKTALETAIGEEETRAKAAEETLTNDLSAEVTRAKAAEEKLANDLTAEQERAVAAEKVLSDKIGTVADGKTVASLIEEEVARAKAAEEANKDAIDALNANAETEGSVDYKIAQAVAAIMQNPDETMNSINELVTWINDHAADALELSNQVSTNKSDIATNKEDIAALEALVGTDGVAAQIEAAIASALKIDGADKYALATDLTAAIARIAAIEGDYLKVADKTELEGKITAAQTAAEQKATDLNAAMETRVKALEEYDHETPIAEALAEAKVDATTKANNAQAAAEETAANALAAAKTELTTEIGKKVDKVDGSRLMTNAEGTKLAGIEAGAEVNVIEVIKVNGKAVTVNTTDRSVDISHNIGDLEQDANTFIIFDCGSATVNI